MISSKNRHFSDQEIAELLAKQGISLARRTVAKYRNELNLGTSYTR
jgi:RNA polymerase sigma-54 factor